MKKLSCRTICSPASERSAKEYLLDHVGDEILHMAIDAYARQKDADAVERLEQGA